MPTEVGVVHPKAMPVMLANALPPVRVPYEWWSMERGSVEFETTAEVYREEARGMARVGL